jgi:hypothetical protein
MKKLTAGFLVAALAVFSGASVAAPYGDNIAEQKTTQRVEDEMAEFVSKLNAACGTNIKASIDWKAYSTFGDADREGRTIVNLYEMAGSLTRTPLINLASGCKDSEIVKAAVVKKVKTITFTVTKGKVSLKVPSHTFKANNGVLAITYNFQNANDEGGVLSAL